MSYAIGCAQGNILVSDKRNEGVFRSQQRDNQLYRMLSVTLIWQKASLMIAILAIR